MINLRWQLVNRCGLGDLEPGVLDGVEASVREILEFEVGLAISRLLSDKQMDEFKEMSDNSDRATALKWLARECPGAWEVAENRIQEVLEAVRKAGVMIRRSPNPGPP